MEPPVMGTRRTAKAKSTGEQCKRVVVGGGVCPVHGRNRHVKANQEARKLRAQAAAYGDVVERSPAEALMGAATTLDSVLRALEGVASTGRAVEPVAMLREIRAAATESGKMQKMVQDAGLDERRLRLEEQQVQLGDVVRLVLEAHGLTVSDAAVRADLGEALRRVGEGDRSPLRAVLAIEAGGSTGS